MGPACVAGNNVATSVVGQAQQEEAPARIRGHFWLELRRAAERGCRSAVRAGMSRRMLTPGAAVPDADARDLPQYVALVDRADKLFGPPGLLPAPHHNYTSQR